MANVRNNVSDCNKFPSSTMNFKQRYHKDALNKSGVAPLRSLIEKAGGWPVLDPDWSEENWDFTEVETVMGGVLLNVDSTYYKGEDGNYSYLLSVSENRLIINFRPEISILQQGINNDIVKDYYNRNVEVAVALGADREAAEAAMKEALEFEITFILVLENLNRSSYDNIEGTNLEELFDSAPNLNLKDLLQKQLPQSYELLPEKKVRTDINNLQVFNQLFNQFPKRTIAHYMMNKAVYPLLKYVIHPLINTTTDDDYDNIHMQRVFGKKSTRLDFCTSTTSKSSLAPAMASYIAIHYKEASKVAADMTHVIKEELVKEVEDIEWFDEQTRSAVAHNLSQLTIDVGFNSLLLDTDKLEINIYFGHEMDTSNFFDAMIYDQSWKKQKELEKLRPDYTKTTADWKEWRAVGLSIHAHFNPTKNAINVSGAMLYLMPLFSAGSPAYASYGQVGTIIAHELIHALDMNAAPEDDYDYLLQDLPEMERWGDNKTESIYNEKKQCFIDFYSAINDTKVTNKKVNGNLTLRENMADSGGLKLCLRAYRKLADQLESPEQKLPQLEQYTAEQLFMISFANVFCEIPNKEYRMEQLRYDAHSPMEFRNKGMAMNSLDFSEIFHCDKNEPMNPPEKCEVWQ